ncbi:MAG: hypothetical protein HQL27_02115 [Candidatus Omnitrophica bacterium]|nr:hypothetical protein [Candidatus Omnitrophota bacterium]
MFNLRNIPLFILLFFFCFLLPINSEASPKVKVEGRSLLVDFDGNGQYENYIIRSTGYSPYPIGRQPDDWGPNIFGDPLIYNRDLAHLRNLQSNTVRIWKGDDTEVGGRFTTKLTTAFLNAAENNGVNPIKVIAGFWIQAEYPWCNVNHIVWNIPDYLNNQSPNYVSSRQAIIEDFKAYVNTFKNHNAILFWALGNENNLSIPTEYNGRKDFLMAWYSLVNQLAFEAHKAECPTYPNNCYDYHPVAVVNGDITSIGVPAYGSTDSQMPDLDIWGTNIYYGISFGQVFNDFASKTSKPLWISEFGTDAYFTVDPQNPQNGYEDQSTQAAWVGRLWDEVVRNNNVCIGASVMEYSDEWWKTRNWEYNDDHDFGGFGPIDTDCPRDGVPDWYPPSADNYFNEEWWGIMSIADNGSNPDFVYPRQVYSSLQRRFECSETTGGLYYAGPDNGKSCDGLSDACCPNPNMKSKNGNCVYSCGGGCFLADTMVLMADGKTKLIQEVKAGDLVMSYDEENKEMAIGKVDKILEHSPEAEYLIVNGTLKVTAIHPVLSKGEWVKIGKMKSGDTLTNTSQEDINIEKIEKVTGKSGEKYDIFNFEVDPHHNYVVLLNGEPIIVHNRKNGVMQAYPGDGNNR